MWQLRVVWSVWLFWNHQNLCALVLFEDAWPPNKPMAANKAHFPLGSDSCVSKGSANCILRMYCTKCWEHHCVLMETFICGPSLPMVAQKAHFPLEMIIIYQKMVPDCILRMYCRQC